MDSYVYLNMYTMHQENDSKKVIRTRVVTVELPNSWINLSDVDDLVEHFQKLLSPIVGELSYKIEIYEDNFFHKHDEEDVIDV